ncbi:DUF2972 domain-containing protein [Helicobacter saguini]|uniref:DUF2972 domain-containing protein n=1 Tax=Helicobacter saguini TaxID=1548018 RepID=A0A347VP26_9HELI|nr:DUF2972 domain-containing protein [Helicobacter saguini]MWV67792.1 DUF2972 domain-containing protein [Helicobacter saguini]MWV70740.1 DUF2972 domain-containing protein [Helicobacter saguini]MWV72643.1 DUF2972 domain-containing protein [Helicobacter saguini]TLD94550.1 DUF2972 domain-containing protein [Helicobacter saguini]
MNLALKIHIIKKNKKIATDSIILTFDRIIKSEKINIMTEITNSDICNDLGLYINKNDLESLRKDKEFFNTIKDFLGEFIESIKKTIDKTEKEMLSEKELLNFFANNKEIALKIKSYLDIDLAHIKTHRPDIVESWEYYKEFERICERF